MAFGLRLIRRSHRAAPATGIAADRGFRHSFLQGFATNIANPKSIAFYAAVFSSAAPAHVAWPTFLAMLAVVGVMATSWYGAVALCLSLKRVAVLYRRAKRWVDRCCGAVIMLLGLRQLLR